MSALGQESLFAAQNKRPLSARQQTFSTARAMASVNDRTKSETV